MKRWLGLAAITLCAAAFLGGRASIGPPRPLAARSFDAGYLAGREAAFAGYDGGWGYGDPYIIRLGRGGPGVTYRIAGRLPLLPRREYRLCGRSVCSQVTR